MRRLAVLLIVGVLVIAAGCSSSSGSEGADGSEDTTVASDTPEPDTGDSGGDNAGDDAISSGRSADDISAFRTLLVATGYQQVEELSDGQVDLLLTDACVALDGLGAETPEAAAQSGELALDGPDGPLTPPDVALVVSAARGYC